MKHFIVINRRTGAIVRSGNCADSDLRIQADKSTLRAIEVDQVYSDLEYYWDGKGVTPRPRFEVEVTGLEISGLPSPTTAVVEGQTYKVADGAIEFEFSYSGTYQVTLSSFPFQDATVEVTQP